MKDLRTPKFNPRKNDPWQLLVMAALFFIPGVCLLVAQNPVAIFHQGYRYRPDSQSILEVTSPDTLHIYGAAAVAMSFAIAAFYFHLRREISRDEREPHRKRR